MENIYRDISQRTDGDIYIGVVGPVRSGKSTLIKRFMETLVLPNIENIYTKERARDELPQSGSGKTIMTAEPKFVPEEAVNISLDDAAGFNVRMIDCVGYMVDGAIGDTEEGTPRMVTTPWCDGEIPMTEAAEIGTRKVITEHSTIGLVVTTDGSITDIPRESYVEAEERVIEELQSIGKPFVVLVNSQYPEGEKAKNTAREISEKYNVTCIPVNCMQLDEEKIRYIIKKILYEFPLTRIEICLPAWFDSLPSAHKIKKEIYEGILQGTENTERIRDINDCVDVMNKCPYLSELSLSEIELGSGKAVATAELPRKLFYDILSEETGFEIESDNDLVPLLSRLSKVNTEYSRVSDALRQVEETGYGIVMPSIDELSLAEPEIVKQGGQYGVRLHASAPSIHMLKTDITTEVAPIVGSEKQSEELVVCMLREFEDSPEKIWDTNIFGKSLYSLVNEGLHNKLNKMPQDAQMKLRETVERITNETCSGLICIIL